MQLHVNEPLANEKHFKHCFSYDVVAFLDTHQQSTKLKTKDNGRQWYTQTEVEIRA